MGTEPGSARRYRAMTGGATATRETSSRRTSTTAVGGRVMRSRYEIVPVRSVCCAVADKAAPLVINETRTAAQILGVMMFSCVLILGRAARGEHPPVL